MAMMINYGDGDDDAHDDEADGDEGGDDHRAFQDSTGQLINYGTEGQGKVPTSGWHWVGYEKICLKHT